MGVLIRRKVRILISELDPFTHVPALGFTLVLPAPPCGLLVSIDVLYPLCLPLAITVKAISYSSIVCYEVLSFILSAISLWHKFSRKLCLPYSPIELYSDCNRLVTTER